MGIYILAILINLFCTLLSLYRRRKVIGFTQDKVEFYESYEMYHSPTTSLPLDTQVRMINFPIFVRL